MSKEYVIVPKEDYVDTCDAIREKINSTALLKSDEMAQAVRDISASAKEEQEKVIEIKENGITSVVPDDGKTLSKVIVDVDVEKTDNYRILFWENYQQYGEREDYEKAFYNSSPPLVSWVLDMIQPIYDFKVNIANSMFRGLIDLVDFNQFLDDRGVSFEFSLRSQTQDLASAGYMFSGCTSLVSVVDLDLEKVSTIIYMFNRCTSLETVHLKNLQSNTNLDGAFAQCTSLKNVTINGVIGNASNVNFGDSSLLSSESVDNIGNALIDLTGLNSKTITFNKAVIEKMSDEQKSVFTNKNWTIASKG